MTSENTSDNLSLGRGWLNRAAEMLDACEDHVSDAEFARAAAAIGNGFIQLAAVERTTAWRAEDLARWTADREAERENDGVVRETNRLILARERGELALVEQRTEALAALDVAALAASGQRERRAEAEARPHDDEQPRGEAAYLLEGDDEVATPLPFLGFTQDGYPVGGPVPADVQAPALVARCGGLAACGACERDALRLQREAGRG